MLDPVPTAASRELLLWVLRRRKRLRVIGASMEPTLIAGDIVVVDNRAYEATEPTGGDVVVATHPRRPDLRIIKRVGTVDDELGIYLESDNRSEPDAQDSRTFGFVEPDLLVGKVTGKIRRSTV